MGRAPCCDKANVKKGPWSPEEDSKLKSYIETYGTGGNWIALPQKAGLRRCGKSCRLRWLNYLRPNLKHGDFSEYEDRVICTLFANIGSRWSIIAGQLPGRTDNDIKNYWNTKLKKKLLGLAHPSPHQAQVTKSSQAHSSSSLFQNHPISEPSLNYYTNNNPLNTATCCSEIAQIHEHHHDQGLQVNPNMHYYVKENTITNSNLLVFGSDQASCSSSDGSCSNSKQDHHHHHNHEMGYVHGFMSSNGFYENGKNEKESGCFIGEIPSDYDHIVDFNKLLLSSSGVDYGLNVFSGSNVCVDDEKKEGMDMSPQYYYSSKY